MNMMAEYIEKTALLEKVIIPSISSVLVSGNEAKRIKKLCTDTVKNTPSADVAPVKHGKWKCRAKHLGECSECGEVVAIRYKYCPNCGARMDGGDDG